MEKIIHYKSSPESRLWSAVLALMIKDIEIAADKGNHAALIAFKMRIQSEHIAWACDVCGVHQDKLLIYIDKKIKETE